MPLCISLPVIYPSAEMDRVCACVCVCMCVCVSLRAHRVIGYVVFKGDDCSGPRGLQGDKVMMAATFSACSSQSP